MVYCDIREDRLIIDCINSDVDYVLEQLVGVPHYNLYRLGDIYAVVVDKDNAYNALLALAECEDVEVV